MLYDLFLTHIVTGTPVSSEQGRGLINHAGREFGL